VTPAYIQPVDSIVLLRTQNSRHCKSS